MRQPFSLFKKALMIFLASLFFLLSAVSAAGIWYAWENEYYTSTKNQLRYDTMRRELEKECTQLYDKYRWGVDVEGYYEGTNFRFEVLDADGKLVIDNMDDSNILYSHSFTKNLYDDYGNMLRSKHTINCYVVESGANIFSAPLSFLEFLFSMRFVLIGILAFCVIVLIVCLVYLVIAAGRKPHRGVACGLIEKIPFDLYCGLYLILSIIFFGLTNDLLYADGFFFVVGGVALAMTAFWLVLSFVMSFSVRVKTRTLLRHMLVYIVISFIFRIIGAFFRMLPFMWKSVLLVAGYLVLDTIWYILSLFSVIFFVLRVFFAILFMAYCLYSFYKLKKGAEAIKSGGFTEQIDTRSLCGEFRSFGNTINTIGDGLGQAVDARIRSERMKTELITNVSHDIKTPLTSIINYVDLLKKEPIESEHAKEYIEVIDRQASRLKKLILDLVEASKASTGNIQVNAERCDIGVLLEQAAGEYDEKLKEAELIPVLRIPDEPLIVEADGRLLWRIFDNLLSNICKYSLPGTRVYLNAAAYEQICIISFKNISRTELNISPDELVERFVRADSSRSTEGNGLGLSIAQSLVELQGGYLEIVADGDLFKVNLQFPLLEGTVSEPTQGAF